MKSWWMKTFTVECTVCWLKIVSTMESLWILLTPPTWMQWHGQSHQRPSSFILRVLPTHACASRTWGSWQLWHINIRASFSVWIVRWCLLWFASHCFLVLTSWSTPLRSSSQDMRIAQEDWFVYEIQSWLIGWLSFRMRRERPWHPLSVFSFCEASKPCGWEWIVLKRTRSKLQSS